MGPRALLIDEAIRRISADVGPVVATSFLYETAPQLVVDQPNFLNAVILVESAIPDPHKLLRALQSIEAGMGRTPLCARPRYGPRPIDLDILCYDDGLTTVTSPDLVVPHPLLSTRSFVLCPLADIRPDLIIPVRDPRDYPEVANASPATVIKLWNQLCAGSNDPPPRRVLPLGAHRIVDLDAIARCRSPLLMAIVNATPDSFSGDGIVPKDSATTESNGRAHLDCGVDEPKERIARAVSLGAEIIDVGGYSTRPGHTDVPVADEIRRVMHVVDSIAGRHRGSTADGRDHESDRLGVDCDAQDERGARCQSTDVLLSIDTFRPAVARACLDALAPRADRHDAVVWINDVMGMRHDPLAMIDLLRAHDGVGIVVMHSGRTLDSMVKDAPLAAQLLAPAQDRIDGGPHDIVDVVARDLLATVRWAESRGVSRWRIALDPGIGFGKSLADNLALVGGAARLRAAVRGYPVLIGASRKSFLGKAIAAATDQRAAVKSVHAGAPNIGLGLTDETREHASHAVTTIAAWEGAHIVRVHDVVGSRAVLDIAAALANGPGTVSL
jgi:dihydropteroate synthase/2-amino-4-hydroxy-6-hydroxymethyldihydropteridine diphosphokinase